MPFNELAVKESENSITITLKRLPHKNAINTNMLQELNLVLDDAEKKQNCRLIILEGQPEVFCNGMDFEEMAKQASLSTAFQLWTSLYMSTLKRLATIPKITIANVDGSVLAGGVGLVAATDLVIATHRSTFKLSEALWGLIPAMVAPYLIRRIGFQKAYTLSLTCQTLPAQEAYTLHLVDMLTETPDEAIQEILRRILRLECKTIGNIKAYFRKLWIIDENIEDTAVKTTSSLLVDSQVQIKIKNFIENGQLPWESSL